MEERTHEKRGIQGKHGREDALYPLMVPGGRGEEASAAPSGLVRDRDPAAMGEKKAPSVFYHCSARP